MLGRTLGSFSRVSTRTLNFSFSTPIIRCMSSVAPDAAAMPEYDRSPQFPEGSIYTKDHKNETFRTVEFPVDDETAPHLDKEWRELINVLFSKHTPSKHPFFAALANMPSDKARNPGFLNELYVRYQAAMHITRAKVWMAPHLDSPLLRQRKIAIIADDDTLEGYPSHHKQLENMFVSFGATPTPQEAFGETDDLLELLDEKTGEFVKVVDRLYPSSTGAWCVAECLSDDWLSAFADSLEPHFPDVKKAQYFDEVFSGHIEIIHMMETVLLTEAVIAKHPSIREATFDHAREMCDNLDDLWANLQELVESPDAYLTA